MTLILLAVQNPTIVLIASLLFEWMVHNNQMHICDIFVGQRVN